MGEIIDKKLIKSVSNLPRQLVTSIPNLRHVVGSI